MLVDFGRLSSFLYLSPGWSQSGVLSATGSSHTGIVIGNVSGIVSLYDLFSLYTVYDITNAFRIEQITNGSFYVGKENDGKVAIYAIDWVVRLTLMSEWVDMTNLILFPWSYIRFDASRNRSLKGADLFRTILSLKDVDNEVFEFVNPRVNIGDEQDTFFNYRLPNSSIILFRALSARFKEKVDMTNDMRQKYNGYGYNTQQDVSKWLLNPSKKNHNMLLELSSLLARALDNNAVSDDIIGKIGVLYKQASTLNIKDSSAKSLVEQFLLDGRFALYGGTANSKYQQTYEQIAKMIGIERSDAQSQLFQSLADIYSRNLFTQKRTELNLTINTYNPTATELAKTLDKDEIAQKDYFDIAIYAYNILRKMEESPQILPESTIEDPATYSYLTTFFRASSRYIGSVEDPLKRQQTIMSFSRQFYDYVLTLVSNSLYKTFVVEEDGGLYVGERFRDGVRITISQDVIDMIRSLYTTVEVIIPAIDDLWSWSGQTDTDTYARITTNVTRIQALSFMINPDTYKDYIKTPYKVDDASGAIAFPMINPKTKLPIQLDSTLVEKVKNTKTLAVDPRINELKKIWPDLDATALSLEWENIRIDKTPYKIGRSSRWVSSLQISALYKDRNLTDSTIYYGDYTIRVITDKPLSQQLYKAFLLQLSSYLDFIDTQVTAIGSDVREIRIFPSKQRINIGDSLYPVDVTWS